MAVKKGSQIANRTNWYQLPVPEVISALATDKAGLKSEEAKLRLKKYGHNELEFKRRSSLVRLLLQFHSPLIYILLASAAITAFLNIWVDFLMFNKILRLLKENHEYLKSWN